MAISVFVNQVGYLPTSEKVALIVGCSRALSFVLVDIENGKSVFQGRLSPAKWDDASGDSVRSAIFSPFVKEGFYIIKIISGMGFTVARSVTFGIYSDVYKPLLNSALETFYFARCGCSLPREFAGRYFRPACHTSRACYADNLSETKDVSGGWHETGDYGRDVTTACAALGNLLNTWLSFPDQFNHHDLLSPPPTQSGTIDTNKALPELLMECRWEIEWLLKMQDNDGGVFRRVAPQEYQTPMMPQKDLSQLLIYEKTAVASASFTAVVALASRIYQPFDAAFSDRLKDAALKGWEWLSRFGLSAPVRIPNYQNSTRDFTLDPENGVLERMITVDFPEGRDNNQIRKGCLFWVSAEMYALTGRPIYHQMLLETWDKVNTTSLTTFSMGGFGALTCLYGPRDAGLPLRECLETAFLYRADNLITMASRSGYMAAVDGNRFVWGSNARLLNSAMTLFIAHKITAEQKYFNAALEQFHNVLGRNPMGISYVTGFGDNSVKRPRHFPSISDGIDDPLEGLLVGGPDMRRSDEFVRWLIPVGTPAAKCYIDREFSYATNDISLNWNALLVHASASASRATLDS